MATISLLIICGYLLWISFHTDHRSQRYLLEVDSHPIEGSEILAPKAWNNSRVGLLNHLSLDSKEGMLLRSRKIHTVGMAFPIDLVYLDRHFEVIHLAPNTSRDLRRIPSPHHTRFILELAANSLNVTFPIKIGSKLKLKERK